MTAVFVHLIVDCPVCAGRGEHATVRDYFGNWDTEPCRPCDGRGEVSAETAAALREMLANPPEWDGP